MNVGDMITVNIWKNPRTGILLEPPYCGIGLWRILWNDGEVGRIADVIIRLESTTFVIDSA